jgi:hypothetical protein
MKMSFTGPSPQETRRLLLALIITKCIVEARQMLVASESRPKRHDSYT